MRFRALLVLSCLLLAGAAPSAAGASVASDGEPGSTPDARWFEAWLVGEHDPDDSLTVPEEGRELLGMLEGMREAISELMADEEAVLARLSDARTAVAATSAASAAARVRAMARADELDRTVVALLVARAEARPSDLRTATLLEDALLQLAPHAAAAASAAEAAEARASAAVEELRAAQLGYSEHLAVREELTSAYAEKVFAAAAELSDRPWGYADGLSCPLYAPAATMRAGGQEDDGLEGEEGGTAGSVLAVVEASGLQAEEPSWVPVFDLCVRSSAAAASAEASLAVRYAFHVLGAPYACDGVGRTDVFRFDCSSFVSRAFSEGAGVPITTASWAPSTRDMVPWDGHRMAGWVGHVDPEVTLPGDLWLFDTGLRTSRHVVMLLADGLMVHTNRCGDVLHITDSWARELPAGVLDLGPRRATFEQWEDVDEPAVHRTDSAGSMITAQDAPWWDAD